MGCVGPKSLISVRNDATFLDLTIQQIEVQNLLQFVCDEHVKLVWRLEQYWLLGNRNWNNCKNLTVLGP